MTVEHSTHIQRNVVHARCPECNADRERGFVQNRPFRYAFVHEYLEWARVRLAAIREGNVTVAARQWRAGFVRALNRRISSHDERRGRKYADGYLERMRMAGRGSESYLRRFAARNASCLD